MDDIVTRLRATGIVEPPLVTPEQAADEIELLRAEVQFWQATAQTAMDNTDKALAVIELHKALKVELEKAVTQ